MTPAARCLPGMRADLRRAQMYAVGGRGLALLVLIGLLSLPLQATASTAFDWTRLDLRLQLEGCGTHSGSAEMDGAHLRLQLPPDRLLGGWSRERGIDLVFTANRRGGLAHDAAPARYAVDPWLLRTDRRGVVELDLRALGRSPSPALSWHLRCLPRAQSVAVRRWRDLHRLSHQLTRWFAQPTPAHGLAMLIHAGIVLARSPHAEDRAWVAEQLAAVARRQRQHPQAAAWFALAEAALTARNPRRKAMAALGGAQSLIAENPGLASKRLRAAALQAERWQMPFAAAVAEHDRCMALRHQGQVRAAIDCYPLVSARFAALFEWNELLRTELNLAHALVQAGELLRARSTLESAARGGFEDLQPQLRARVLGARARYATWAGEFETAFDLLARAIAIYADQQPFERAQATASLADTYALAGQSQRALGLYRESITTLQRIEARHEFESTVLRLARLQHSLGQLDAARASLALLDGADAGMRSIDRLETQLDRARLWLLAGDHGRARALIEPLRAQVSALGLWVLQARLLAVDAALAGDGTAELDDRMQRTATQAREQGQLLLYLDLQAARLRRAQRANDDRAMAEIAAQTLQPARQLVAAARSPELRRTLVARLRGFASVRLGELPDGPVTEQRVRWALAPLDELRQLARQTVPNHVDSEALAQLERMLAAELLAEPAAAGEASDRARLNTLIDHASDTPAGEYPAHRPPRPWPLADPATVWLYPVFVDDSLHLLWRDRHGWTHARSDAAGMRAAVTEVSRLLREGHAARQDLRAVLQAIAAGLEWTSHIGPDTGHLVVVAESELSMLPWELLSWQRDDALAPRLTVVQGLLEGQASRGEPRLHRVLSDQRAGSSMASLPEAARELEQVAAAWRSRLPLAGVVRDRGGLLQALASPGALVHVASHAQRGQGVPEDAGLWLADAGHPEFVSALRLRRSAVHAGLVVLNACDSGDLAPSHQLGVGGLAGSLLDAGAGAVVATRWPVSDRSARLFAQRFHRALAATPDDPALALQRATRELRSEPAMQHPSAWAAWVLIRSGPEPARLAQGQP